MTEVRHHLGEVRIRDRLRIMEESNQQINFPNAGINFASVTISLPGRTNEKQKINMKTLFSIVLFISVLTSCTSTVYLPVAAEPTKYTYCEMIGNPRPGGNVSVRLAYDVWMKDPEIRGIKEFKTMLDGMDYMRKDGWELHTVYVVRWPGGANVYHWVLKKQRDDVTTFANRTNQ